MHLPLDPECHKVLADLVAAYELAIDVAQVFITSQAEVMVEMGYVNYDRIKIEQGLVGKPVVLKVFSHKFVFILFIIVLVQLNAVIYEGDQVAYFFEPG